MGNLNEILKDQIDKLNYNRDSLIEAIDRADETSSNYGGKINELRTEISNTDTRIDELMNRITGKYQKTEDGSILKTK